MTRMSREAREREPSQERPSGSGEAIRGSQSEAHYHAAPRKQMRVPGIALATFDATFRRRDASSASACSRPAFCNETVNFLDWADEYVNQLDPLHEAERTGEFEESSTYHFQNDLDRLKKAFGRLLGGDWEDAWKVSEDYTPKPRKGYYYGERSVFEVGSGVEDDDGDA